MCQAVHVVVQQRCRGCRGCMCFATSPQVATAMIARVVRHAVANPSRGGMSHTTPSLPVNSPLPMRMQCAGPPGPVPHPSGCPHKCGGGPCAAGAQGAGLRQLHAGGVAAADRQAHPQPLAAPGEDRQDPWWWRVRVQRGTFYFSLGSSGGVNPRVVSILRFHPQAEEGGGRQDTVAVLREMMSNTTGIKAVTWILKWWAVVLKMLLLTFLAPPRHRLRRGVGDRTQWPF